MGRTKSTVQRLLGIQGRNLHDNQAGPSGINQHAEDGTNTSADGITDSKTTKKPSSTREAIDVPIRELWNLAYEKLREEEQHLVESYEAKLFGNLGVGISSISGLKVNRCDRMKMILSRKIDEINRDAWKLRFGNSEAKVGEMLQYVCSVANEANDIITKAVSATPYVSIAWAGVGVLLPILLNSSEQSASLAKGLEYVSALIFRSQIREEIYERRYDSKTGDHTSARISHAKYKDAWENLYRQILKFQATAYCYYASNSAIRLGRNTVRWDDWDKLLDDIQRQEHIFNELNAAWKEKEYEEECSAAERRHKESLDHWNVIGTGVSDLKKAIEDSKKDKKRIELLKWLCTIDPSVMYNAARDKHEDRTNDWLLYDKRFKTWEESRGSFLWLHGKAGSGKSVLTSSVVKRLRDRHTPDPWTAFAHFYFSFSDQRQQNVDGMLGSLVKQLYACRPNTPQAVENLGKYKEKGERPDTRTLEAAITATARGFSKVYIVIDALDECPLLNRERKRLLDSLCRIVTAAPDNVSIFCTSRKEPDIDAAFRALLSLPSRDEMDLITHRGEIDRDIGLYIDSTLASADYDSWPPRLKNKAKKILVKKSDGMFQYVYQQFQALWNLPNEPAIDKALESLPAGLDETYNRLLLNTDPMFQSQVISLLKWLAFSNTTLSLEILAEVFILHPEQEKPFDEKERLFKSKDVLKYLGSLVVTQVVNSRFSMDWRWASRDKNDRHDVTIVRLTHFSVKEYLTSSRIAEGPATHFKFTDVDAHLHIAHSCLAYHLCRNENTIDQSNILTYALRRYAALNWPVHLESIKRSDWPAVVAHNSVRALTTRSRSLYNMINIGNIDRTHFWPGGDSREPLRHWLIRPEAFTANLGYLKLTDMLLSRECAAKKYITQGDLDMALQDAAYGGNKTVIELLLEKGADINAKSAMFKNALQAAAYKGNAAIVEFLLENDGGTNAKRGGAGSALLAAAVKGHVHIVRLLVNRKDIHFSPDDLGCALVSAIGFRSIECRQILLDSGANINWQRDGDQGSVLYHIAREPYGMFGEQIRMLLDRGADINAPGGKYGYPLQAACVRDADPYHVIEILLNRGANINAQGGKFGSALQAACYGRDPDRPFLRSDSEEVLRVAKLLVGRGANVNAEGGYYGTALQAACASGKDGLGVVEFLLEMGADVNTQAGFHGNALQAACYLENLDLVRLLLDRGAKANTSGGTYGNALQAAASASGYKKSKRSIMELLLSRGADVNQKGGLYGTALQAMAANSFFGRLVTKGLNRSECLELLLDSGAEVNQQGGLYGTALQAACSVHDIACVQLLLRRGAHVNTEGGQCGTALRVAYTYANTDIACLLLEHGADVHAQGGSAWHAAVRIQDGYDAALQALLDRGVDIDDARGGRYPTALEAAFRYDYRYEDFRFNNIRNIFWNHRTAREKIRFLLDHGANPNLAAGAYGFPLQAAAYLGEASQVQLLLERGADVSMRGGKYGSALNAAIVRGYWDTVELLLENGAKPDCYQQREMDEEWLSRVREEEDGEAAVERYRLFWERQVEKRLAAGILVPCLE